MPLGGKGEMQMMTGRRTFLACGAAAFASGCASPRKCPRCEATAEAAASAARRVRFRLGMAGYTYNKFSADETLAALKRLGVHGLCVKDFHLPLTASKTEIAVFRKKCEDAEVVPYGAGPISLETTDEAKRAFDYAAELKVPVVVGIPWKPGPGGSRKWNERVQSPELCEAISGLAASYDIKFAIHNHGRNPLTGVPALFGAPVDVWNIVKHLDRHMGLCMDIAYTFADGFDPADAIRAYAPRLFDCHFRNISDPSNGSSGTNSADGKIDYLRVVEALAETGYSGWCGIELANAFPSNPDWIPASVGYFTGLMQAADAPRRN